MEKGKLIVTKSKKGFRGEIEFLNSKGKLSRLAITSYKFNNDSLNGNDCYFKRVGGQLVELTVNGIKLIPSNVNKPKRNLPSFNNSVNLWATNNKYLRMPSDTAEIIDMNVVDNYSLKLNKLAHFFSVEKSSLHAPSFNDNPNLYISEFDNKAEKKSKDDKSKYLKYFNIFSNFGDFDFNLKVNNNLSTAKALFKTETAYKAITFKPNWRMVVGLGGESVYETSITLHHIYGIPYIPASSIKGVVRSWIITSVFGNSESNLIPNEEKQFPLVNAEYRAFQNENFCYIFGCPAEIDKVIFENGKPKTKKKNGKEVYTTKKYATKLKQIWEEKNKKFTGHIGSIIFFDAFPIKEPNIEPDIMNVHYPDYYDDKKGVVAPTDYQNPRPITFLTVKDTPFRFIIGSKKEKLDHFKIDGHSIDWWLKESLSNHGIGAKTAVGYGRMIDNK